MGAAALSLLLKSLCSNSLWNYAVLWNLSYQDERILTWEDGYLDYPKEIGTPESIPDYTSCSSGSGINQWPLETCIDSGSSRGFPIREVVASISDLKYKLGEGIVGEVASTGQPCWVHYDQFIATNLNFKLPDECPNEWLVQFASGFKTIALLPVLEHGVLQLGSLDWIAEDPAEVAYIENYFSLPHVYGGDYSETLTSLLDQFMSELHAQESLVASLPSIWGIINEGLEPVSEESTPSSQFPSDTFQLDIVENKTDEFSYMEEEQSLYSLWKECTDEAFPNLLLDVDTGGDLVEQMGDINVNYAEHQGPNWFAAVCSDFELDNAIEPAPPRNLSFDEGKCNNSSIMGDIYPTNFGEVPIWAPEEGRAEYLLQAVVANKYNTSDHSSSISDAIMSASTMSGQITFSSHPQCEFEVAKDVGQNFTLLSNVTSSFAPKKRNIHDMSASFNSLISTVINEDQNEWDHSPRPKGRKLSDSKRRAKPGENQKTRPRDRQLIQDRVKELRELVPNGAKFSIDGLLERTIQHIQHLRSATDQAATLKEMEHQVVVRDSMRTSKVKRGFQGGTSWAMEVGNEPTCPIVVEDLASPRHMLIEMLCDEPSIFLEIAQVIKSMELTILKGATETRGKNKWAHFIVEVRDGFQRLDIFWPLMQILQRNRNNKI